MTYLEIYAYILAYNEHYASQYANLAVIVDKHDCYALLAFYNPLPAGAGGKVEKCELLVAYRMKVGLKIKAIPYTPL